MTSWIYALNCSCLQFIVAEIVSFLARVVDCHLNVPVPPTRFFSTHHEGSETLLMLYEHYISDEHRSRRS